MNPVVVPCPHCQRLTSFEPITVLKKGMPELSLLFESRLNTCQCSECKQEFLYETPLLYRDDDAPLLIYYIPSSQLENLDQALTQMQTLRDRIFADLPDNRQPRCRLAVNHSQFIEKIAIHQSGYDDRLMEYIKYQLFQHSSGLNFIRYELLFDFSGSSAETLNFIAFARETRQAEYTLEFSISDYRNMEKWFLADEREKELDKLFHLPLVRVDDLIQPST